MSVVWVVGLMRAVWGVGVQWPWGLRWWRRPVVPGGRGWLWLSRMLWWLLASCVFSVGRMMSQVLMGWWGLVVAWSRVVCQRWVRLVMVVGSNRSVLYSRWPLMPL